MPLFERGSITLTGLNANDTATYSCDLGHKLVGVKVVVCQLGGKWSAPPPTCRFVDCGPLPDVEHGAIELVNASTTFGSQAMYTCEEDFKIHSGRQPRLCQEDGTWSGTAPVCERKNNFYCIIFGAKIRYNSPT